MINKRHDYEATVELNRRSLFQIQIGDVSHDVVVNLINIFDNDPMIQYDVPCTFEVNKLKVIINRNQINSWYFQELNEPMFRSGCIFTVTTIDGFIGNRITLEPQNVNFRSMFQFECLNCDQLDRANEQYELM